MTREQAIDEAVRRVCRDAFRDLRAGRISRGWLEEVWTFIATPPIRDEFRRIMAEAA